MVLREETNYGVRRIADKLKDSGIEISYGGAWKILRRNGESQPKKKSTIRRTGRRYYNPLDFEPFSFLQIDIKEVVEVGEEQSFANGWLFIIFVVVWLRAFSIKGKIVIQSDWGEVFGGKSERKT